MKTFKSFLWAIFITYLFLFALDYCSIRRHGSKEFCTRWMQTMPWWGHLAMPGPANGCIDEGYWP